MRFVWGDYEVHPSSRVVGRTKRYALSYDWRGNQLTWKPKGLPAGVAFACDLECTNNRTPMALKRFWRVKNWIDFYKIWTLGEVVCKLHGEPMHLFVKTTRVNRFDFGEVVEIVTKCGKIRAMVIPFQEGGKIAAFGWLAPTTWQEAGNVNK